MKQVTDIKAIQSVIMQIFKLLDEFCKENGIEYFAAYGSISKLFRWVDQKKVTKKTEDIMSKYLCGDSDTLLIPRGQKKGKFFKMPAEWFSEAIDVEYGDTKISVPKGYGQCASNDFRRLYDSSAGGSKAACA